MRERFRASAASALAVALLLAAGGGAGAAERPGAFLAWLAGSEGGVVVAHGAEDDSRQAAEVVAEAIRALPGHADWDRLVEAAAFDAEHFDVTGGSHVIAVGRLWDNPALRGRDWLPTWWMDFDWYHAEYAFALSPSEMGLPYQDDSGFLAAGYGHWPRGTAGVGYVEVDRSHYFMEWMVRTRFESVVPPEHRDRYDVHNDWRRLEDLESPTYPTDVPLRLIVRVTGSGGAGVVAAAEAFARRGMLNGVVLAAGARADDAPAMFTLPAGRYHARPPLDPPAEVAGFRYHGWLLPSAFHYDGFANETGIAPRRMHRLKYAPPFGITNFWTSPHRRSGQFEVSIVELASEDEAGRAHDRLMASLAERDAARDDRVVGFGVERVGATLLLESIPGPAGSEVLAACVAAWKEARP